MPLFIPRSLCALKRVAAKVEHAKFGATQGIRIALASGMYRAEATDGRRAMVVQGLVPDDEPPWPGFKELPDDAFETVILPRDLDWTLWSKTHRRGKLCCATSPSEKENFFFLVRSAQR